MKIKYFLVFLSIVWSTSFVVASDDHSLETGDIYKRKEGSPILHLDVGGKRDVHIPCWSNNQEMSMLLDIRLEDIIISQADAQRLGLKSDSDEVVRFTLLDGESFMEGRKVRLADLRIGTS